MTPCFRHVLTGIAAAALLGVGAPSLAAPVESDSAAIQLSSIDGLALLLAKTDNAELAAFYEARGHAPAWGAAGEIAPERARALKAAIADAPRHALPMARFRPVELDAALARPWDARAEMLFAEVYLDYARAVSSGLLTPRRLGRDFDVRPIRPEVSALMTDLATSQDPDGLLAALVPSDPDYAALMTRHEALVALAEQPEAWGPALPKGRSLKEGDRGPRVAALRARMIAMEYLEPARPAVDADAALVAADGDGVAFTMTTVPDELYDPTLVEAVKAFQARYGLNTDGVVGPATRAVLNTSPAKRARQVAVNLERIRWNNGKIDRDGRRVMVNMPDFRVDVMEGDEIAFTTRAVIGKYKHQTVEFSDTMDHMVINPTWHVPMSIARNEILPKLREDPGYLEARNMTLVSGEDPWLIDWETMTPSDFPGRVRQAPGPGNALGRVKFMFPNNHAIYLHDTPQRGLFRRDNRAYSHGCVRVERPLELAHYLLSGQVDSPERSFQRWLRTGREIYVNLDQPLPVHLVYRTAFTDADGQPAFRSDVYRRDAKVAAALEKAGVSLPAL
ncbi:MAG: L,D-transpeptidase family protein [Pseudomonadota bacterium]